MSCAGGLDVTATKIYNQETLSAGTGTGNETGKFESVKVLIKGLKGGHSGGDIQLGLGNSNKLLARFLNESLKHLAQISKMESGGLRNAIPREGYFIIAVPKNEMTKLLSDLENLKSDVLNEFKSIEPNIAIEIQSTENENQAASFEDTKKLAQALMSAFNGVYRMSPE